MTHVVKWVKGQGSTLAVSLTTTGTITYTPVDMLQECSGPSKSVPSVPTTNVSSTAVGKRGGLPDMGTIEFSHFWDPASPSAIIFQTAITSGQEIAWQITYPDTTTEVGLGFLAKYEPSGVSTDNKNLLATGSIEVDGSTTLTPNPN